MPILIGLYRVIQSPIKYLLHVNFEDPGVSDKITNIITLMSEKFPQELGSYASMGADKLFKNAQIQLATWSEMVLDKLDAWSINFDFLGMNLAKVPSAALSFLSRGDFSQPEVIALLIIPALAMFTTWLSMKQSQNMSGQNNQNNANEQAAQMGKSMSMMMPIMTGVFSFTLPSGMGIYWIVSNVVQMLQQYLLNIYFNQKEDDFVVKLPNKNRKNSKKHR